MLQHGYSFAFSLSLMFLQERRGSAAKALMKVVILAGGLGTRLTEETETRPKPMVEIGGRPILWHIMKLYAHYGFRSSWWPSAIRAT